MATKPAVEQRSRQMPRRELRVSPSLSQILGMGLARPDLSPDAFYTGLRPIAVGLKNGTLTEEQAALLIKLLASAYAGTAVNHRIDTLFQNWAERLTAARSDVDYGGR